LELWDDELIGKAAIEENVVGTGRVIVHFVDEAGEEKASGGVSIRMEGEPEPEDAEEPEGIGVHGCMRAWVYACVFVYMYGYLYVFVHVCVCVCMCVCECILHAHAHTSASAQPHTHTPSHPYIHIDTHIYTYVQTHVFMYAYIYCDNACEVKVIVRVGKFKINKKQDLIGKGDPYIVVRLGEDSQQTDVIKNTQKPVFNKGIICSKSRCFSFFSLSLSFLYFFTSSSLFENNICIICVYFIFLRFPTTVLWCGVGTVLWWWWVPDFPFTLPAEEAPLIVELWDRDEQSKDDFVGKTAIEENIVGKGRVTVHLVDDAGEEQGSGDVSIRLEGEPAPEDEPEPEPKLVVHVGRFRIKKGTDIAGKGDMHMVVRLGGEEQQTEIVPNTRKPVFNKGMLRLKIDD
jgi:hypothetical protein